MQVVKFKHLTEQINIGASRLYAIAVLALEVNGGLDPVAASISSTDHIRGEIR